MKVLDALRFKITKLEKENADLRAEVAEFKEGEDLMQKDYAKLAIKEIDKDKNLTEANELIERLKASQVVIHGNLIVHGDMEGNPVVEQDMEVCGDFEGRPKVTDELIVDGDIDCSCYKVTNLEQQLTEANELIDKIKDIVNDLYGSKYSIIDDILKAIANRNGGSDE